nr:DNA polymerase III subunit gamma/tau [uncultured Peptostreptococcus sp.]
MHKALYREYRPLVFDDIIGQEHIVKTLKNQIKDNSMSHAYLFCGTRGTGKTTTAKILSRAVNCQVDSKDHPCNECPTCVSILDSSNLDVIEIDAASNNSVDDIRELRDTVKYTPANSKYKVYIIDEVHMLSQGAFNALLKTLEEPPSYVIFILATTEPNKIPATILSRCQRFDFKRVSVEELMDRMRLICQKEDISIDEDALRIIARNGQGSVRDSLSILDKCLSFGGSTLTGNQVIDLLGGTDPDQLFKIAKSIIESDVCKSMEMIDDYFMWGKDLRLLVEDITDFFRTLMMIKIFGQAGSLVDLSKDQVDSCRDLADKVETEEIIRILTILSELIDKLRLSSNQRMTLEIYIMKLSSPAMDQSDKALAKRLEKLEKLVEDGMISINATISPDMVGQVNLSQSSNQILGQEKQDKLINSGIDSLDNFDIIDDENLVLINEKWDKFLDKMKEDKKMPLRAFLIQKQGLTYKNDKLYIIMDDKFEFAIERLEEPANKSYIKEALSKVCGIKIEIEFIKVSDASKIEFDKEYISEEEKSPEELLLQDVLGDTLEIKDK